MKVWRNPAFLTVAFLVVIFGGVSSFNIYKHVRYSHFTLAITGDHGLRLGQKKIASVEAKLNHTVFNNLPTNWWNSKPSYTITNKGVGPILAYPTFRGGLILTNPSPRGNDAYAVISMESMSGHEVQYMLPYREYRLKEGETTVLIQFHWDN